MSSFTLIALALSFSFSFVSNLSCLQFFIRYSFSGVCKVSSIFPIFSCFPSIHDCNNSFSSCNSFSSMLFELSLSIRPLLASMFSLGLTGLSNVLIPYFSKITTLSLFQSSAVLNSYSPAWLYLFKTSSGSNILPDSQAF